MSFFFASIKWIVYKLSVDLKILANGRMTNWGCQGTMSMKRAGLPGAPGSEDNDLTLRE